jgi:hypothetical protein
MAEETESENILTIDAERLQRIKDGFLPAIGPLGDAWIGTAKWLLASLLILNGGAIVGLLNSGRIPLANIRGPLAIFIIGIALAMFAGLNFARASARGLQIALNILRLHPGPISAEEVAEFDSVMGTIHRYDSLTDKLGIFSLVAFIVGAFWTAYSVPTPPSLMPVAPSAAHPPDPS